MTIDRSGDNSEPALKLNKWGEMCAGAIAGGFSRFLVTPLDVLKIRFQLQIEPIAKSTSGARIAAPSPLAATAASLAGTPATANHRPPPYYTSMSQAFAALLKEEGVRTLWRGNIPAMTLWIAYMGVQFPIYRAANATVDEWWYGKYQRISASSGTGGTAAQAKSAPKKHIMPALIAGAAAGCLATALTYPLDWLRTRWASQGIPRHHHTMRELVHDVYRSSGLRGYFPGLLPSLLSVGPALAVTFAVYEQCGSFWDRHVSPLFPHAIASASAAGPPPDGADHSSHHQQAKHGADAQMKSLICGGIGGTAGKLAVYPLDTVKKRLQVQGMVRDARYGAMRSYDGIWHALVTIAREEGVVRGWYKGTAPSVIKAAAAAGLTFWSYESAASWLRRRSWAVENGG